MKSAIIALTLLASSSVFADGFVCYSGNLKVQVYNEVNASEGTRNAAAMIISDTTVQVGRKTIATFTSDDLQLGNEGADYTANVDSRFSGAERIGELIGGTKLGELKAIVLDIAFSFAAPVAEGTELAATLNLVKENGEIIPLGATCERYLKQ